MNEHGRQDTSFDELVEEAAAATIAGWDFSRLDSRTRAEALSWSYPDLARAAIVDHRSLLDVDTGGGEQLSALHPLPDHTVATEGWVPNVSVATHRLTPLGVAVRPQPGNRIPAEDGEFELVLNRHGRLDPDEVWRVLAPGGTVLTPQVGSRNDIGLNAALGAPAMPDVGLHDLATAAARFEERGFTIDDAREEFPRYVFDDIGAIVFHLRAVPWQITDFDPAHYRARLHALHHRIVDNGEFVVHDHRYLIRAGKPA